MKIYRKESKEIYREAADYLIKTVAAKIKEGKKTLLLLSGGSSVNLYTYLSSISELLVIAQVDERFQPESREDINAEAIERAGFQVPYYIVSQEGSVERAAEEYNKTIETLWKECDDKIAVLGIGFDCHTAGLIPGYEKDWNVDRFVVGYDLGQNNANALFCPQKFRRRITVTPKLLKQLNYALVVAVGEKKKEAIKNALKKENLQDLNTYPAAIIQKIPQLDLFTNI